MGTTTRRTVLKAMSAVGVATVIPCPLQAKFRRGDKIKLGVIADLHGGFAPDADRRLDQFLETMRTEACDALVQLGDFAYPNEENQAFPDKFNAAADTTLHVIGNHEFDFGLKLADCYRAWGMESSYYRRDIGGVRILVLDGNETGSPKYTGGYPAYIGDRQLGWLESELRESDKPVMILSHQPLAGFSAIDNADKVQKLLAEFKSRILICLNGHSHVDSLEQVDGVSYLHVNSASYFWVGGQYRMARYTDSLFTTITVDPENATVTTTASIGRWQDKSPEQIGYFGRKDSAPRSAVMPRIRARKISRSELTVMTWNIWGRMNQDPRYTVDKKTARQRTIEILRHSGADVIAMIETYGSAKQIATALGYHYHTAAADANLCIFSRYPLSDVELLEGLNPFSFIAATVELPGGQRVRVIDIWLTSGGRHIVEIKNGSVSDQEFGQGDDNRFEHLQQLLQHKDFRRDVGNADEVPLIVAGDFNCVSHLDYTQATRDNELNYSRILSSKVSQAMQKLGFRDTYRHANPTLTTETLGHTWTTVGTDYMYDPKKGFVPADNHPRPQYRDPFARIDYIYSLGKKLNAIDSSVITRYPSNPDQGFPAFPSDHAAVVTRFRIEK